MAACTSAASTFPSRVRSQRLPVWPQAEIEKKKRPVVKQIRDVLRILESSPRLPCHDNNVETPIRGPGLIEMVAPDTYQPALIHYMNRCVGTEQDSQRLVSHSLVLIRLFQQRSRYWPSVSQAAQNTWPLKSGKLKQLEKQEVANHWLIHWTCADFAGNIAGSGGYNLSYASRKRSPDDCLQQPARLSSHQARLGRPGLRPEAMWLIRENKSRGRIGDADSAIDLQNTALPNRRGQRDPADLPFVAINFLFLLLTSVLFMQFIIEFS